MEPDVIDPPAQLGALQVKRPLPDNANALILFNQNAGSVHPGDREKLVQAVTEAGVTQYTVIGIDKLSTRFFERQREFDVIIVLGGDGTARAAAEMAPRNGPPLILLPGGTLNVLPQALYGPRAWPDALKAALERGVVKRMPMGRANGSTFFVAAMFGAPTLLARAREAVREGKPLTALGRVRHFLRRAFARDIRARCGDGKFRKTEAAAVLCPLFSGALEGEAMEFVRLDVRHLGDLARVSIRALWAGWRKDLTVEISHCTDADVYSYGTIPAALDGEPKMFLSAVRIRYSPNGPRVIALDTELTNDNAEALDKAKA
ncbi:MAG: diacylglycerol kinase family protein [Terricaulis sp.]